MADGGEDIIPSYRLLAGIPPVDPPDGPSRPCVDEVGLGVAGVAIFEPHCIESLLILPPAGRPDEALVLEVDPLPAQCDEGLLQAAIPELKSVELDILRVGNDRIGGHAV